MALTKKCDRCGNVYDHYGIDPTFGNTDKNRGKVQENGFSVIYWLYNESKFKNIHGYDLCPKCLEELIKWFNNPDATVNIFKCTPMGNTEVDGKQLSIDELPLNNHTEFAQEQYDRKILGKFKEEKEKEEKKNGRKRKSKD